MKKFLFPLLALLLVIVVAYFIVPFRFSFPIKAHDHLQFQFYYNENRFDLSGEAFQIPSDPYTCSDNLSDEPLHFHDGNPEVLHIHWAGIRGKDFLKYYGFLGNDSFLGYRWDTFPTIQKVKIHGDLLPEPQGAEKVWVFSQDADNNIQQIEYKDFLILPLSSKLDSLTAEAHGEEDHGEGKFIILIQENEPNMDFVFQQFQTFLPMEEASCSE